MSKYVLSRHIKNNQDSKKLMFKRLQVFGGGAIIGATMVAISQILVDAHHLGRLELSFENKQLFLLMASFCVVISFLGIAIQGLGIWYKSP